MKPFIELRNVVRTLTFFLHLKYNKKIGILNSKAFIKEYLGIRFLFHFKLEKSLGVFPTPLRNVFSWECYNNNLNKLSEQCDNYTKVLDDKEQVNMKKEKNYQKIKKLIKGLDRIIKACIINE